MNRTQTTTVKVSTNFGTMYLHIETDAYGRPVGGSISTPGKEPESQIHILVETLSAGLQRALNEAAQAEPSEDQPAPALDPAPEQP